MSSLNEKFKVPLPIWIEKINQKSYEKFATSKFAELCRNGDVDAMRKVILGIWPFVDEFPNMLDRGCKNLLFRMDLILKFGLVDVYRLLRKGRRILKEIQGDEEEHRKLWLMTGRELGLNYPRDFYSQSTLPSVKKWIDKIDSASSPFIMFMRFTAIEIIAECVSKNLLGSTKFVETVGLSGSRWFKAHIYTDNHPGMTHEELALHLGFALHSASPSEEECDSIIQEIVELAIHAADDSVSQ